MRTNALLFSLSLLLIWNSTALSKPNKKGNKKFVDREILVKFKHGASNAQKQAAMSAHGHNVKQWLKGGDLAHVGVPSNQTVDQAVAMYASNPLVEYAQPNYVYYVSAAPNDPSYGQTWAFKNTGQTISSPGGPDPVDPTHNPGAAGNDLGTEAAWNLLTDCRSVTVAVVDTGANYDHVDLVNNMWDGGVSYPHHGYDFVSSDDTPADLNGHGTHVAGIIAAEGNNGVGTSGVCWRASLMAVRVLGADGSGSSAAVIQGIDFAVAHGAKIVNMSLGGTTYDPTYLSTLSGYPNTLFVVAAGNDGEDNDGATPTYPCSFKLPNLICVAALDQNYSLASFSNYGATTVHVGAPGVNIVSDWIGAVTSTTDALTTGWTQTSAGSGWGNTSILTSNGLTNILANPPAFDHSAQRYANNSDDRYYKAFDLSTGDRNSLLFDAFYDTESSKDFFKAFCKSSGGDPTSGGTSLLSLSGSSNSFSVSETLDLAACASASTTIGFQLTSDSANINYGVAIYNFALSKLTFDTTSYAVLEGTSMATPYVAGVAALLLAFNPNDTPADVIAALENGGTAASALAGKTVSGKSVNAMGSLSYLNPPSGVTLQKQ